LSAWLNAALLLRGLHQRGWYQIAEIPWKPVWQVGLALIVMVQVGWWAPTALELATEGMWMRVVLTAALLGFAGVFYLATLWLVGIRYTRMLVPPKV
jgi:putative peptidoglycan lipid II flippase